MVRTAWEATCVPEDLPSPQWGPSLPALLAWREAAAPCPFPIVLVPHWLWVAFLPSLYPETCQGH